jgi:hypothetical protein
MKKSPAQVYALLFGATLLVAGIAGFFYSADFSTGAAAADPRNRDALIGVFDVNGWTDVLYVLTGAAGLAAARSWVAARRYAFGVGALYLILAGIGFALGDGHAIFGLIIVNTADNVLHVVVAVLGLLTAIASPNAPRPTLEGERSLAFEPSVRPGTVS